MLLPQWSKRRKTRRIGIVVLCFCWVTFIANAQNDEEVSISGTLKMLDDKTPHVACVVQAVTPVPDGQSEPLVVATTLSDENGKYQLVDLDSGRYQVRCHTLNGYVYYREHENTVETSSATFLQVERDRTFSGIDLHFAPFKKGTWKNYTVIADGLAHDEVYAVYQDSDGVMWFGTFGGGVSRYDGKAFVNFTTADGLAHDVVYAVHQDSDGVMWFGTYGGVSRYDGKRFVNFTTADGLAHDTVVAVYQDSDGVMWFGTGGGVSRYDGKAFVSFTTADGLAHDTVVAVYQDSDGVMWFGTEGGGVSRYDVEISRYDGNTWTSLDTREGLAGNMVRGIHQDISYARFCRTAL